MEVGVEVSKMRETARNDLALYIFPEFPSWLMKTWMTSSVGTDPIQILMPLPYSVLAGVASRVGGVACFPPSPPPSL